MEENQYLIKFKKPYEFEGGSYNEVDLSGLEDLTARDLSSAEKVVAASGQMPLMSEMTVAYACVICAAATKKPVEFFNELPAREAVKVKNMVTGFFYEQE